MTNDIYEAAKARGLVRSLRQFSTGFLGRCPHYAADRGLDRCSAGALLNLYKRLGELGHADLHPGGVVLGRPHPSGLWGSRASEPRRSRNAGHDTTRD